ncbi:hypothetical protein [Streptomyces sp. NBC_00842]|uniref:hypothetical protein n=1 Tax=Streptomyces sp. NBC_00842 TaxID=2975848 RepID=UPI002F916846|nr:hypothetical protein OH821_45305 [Streptomyces sp. NBC_00842]
MSSKKRNVSSRTAKLQRQARARAERSTHTPAPKPASFPAALQAFEQAFAIGHLPALRSNGQVQELTFDRIREHFNAEFAADGEPPLSAGELSRLLADDLVSGEMAMRADGVWLVSEDYFTDREAL